MKKIVSLLLFLVYCVLFTSSAPLAALQNTNEYYLISEKVEYCDDGYNIIRLYESTESSYRNTYTKTGVAEYLHYSSDNTLVWKYTLTGYFEVNQGISSICYDVDYSTQINSNGWHFYNNGTYYNGNTAYGAGTFKYKVLMITINTINVDLSVTCDIYGNIS